MPRRRTTDALLTLAGVGLSSGLIYWLVFVRPFPLAHLYNIIPPVDYAKLTDHSAAGALSYTLAIFALFVGYLIALKALRFLSEDPAQRRWVWAQRRWAWGIVFGGTILFGVTLALAYPTTAIDLLIYAVRTRGWALYGLNPLATPPQDHSAIPGWV